MRRYRDFRTLRRASEWPPIHLGGLVLILTALGAAMIGLSVMWDPPRRQVGTDVYTIPPGTAARVARGEDVADVLPQRVTTSIGHQLVVVNRDVEAHAFGPFILAPGQQWARQFAIPGNYEMTCTIYPDAGFTVAVADDPPSRPQRYHRRPTTNTAYWAMLSMWLLFTALTVGLQLAAAVARAGSPAEEEMAAEFARLSQILRAVVPTMAVLAATALVASLSRAVPWRVALSGTASLDAWFAAAWTIVAALAIYRFVPVTPTPSSWTLSMTSFVILWPATRVLSPAVSPLSMLLLLTGLGLLIVSFSRGIRSNAVGTVDQAVFSWLAAAGIAFVVAGVPLPPTGVAPRLVAGSLDLAIGLALIVALTRSAPRVDLARLGYAAAFAAGAMGAFQLALAAVGGVMGG